VETCLEMDRI